MKNHLAFSSVLIAVLTTVFAVAMFLSIPYLARNACINCDARGFAVVVGAFKVLIYIVCSVGGAFATASLKKVPEHKRMAWTGLTANIAIVIVTFQLMRISLA